MRDAFVNALIEIAKKDRNVYLLTGDLGFGVLKPYWEQLPKQFINVGIAEQAMAGIAAGLACENNKVFVYSIGNFPTLRCLEQIRNDCAYHDANVKFICVGGGFTYGSLGMSHHATEDIAIMRALPNVTVCAPSDARQAIALTHKIYEHPGTCYLRLGRGGELDTKSGATLELGKAIKLQSGKDIAILYTGAIYDEVRASVLLLKKKGINASIYNFHTVKPLDTNMLYQIAKNYNQIYTIEEHNIIGGFGSAVCEFVASMKEVHSFVIRIGLNDTYSSVVGSQKYLREQYGLDANAISKTILKSALSSET